MFKSRTSRPLRTLIQNHEEHPGDTEFDVNLIETRFLDRILYKRITVSKNKIFFSGKNVKSKIKEIEFFNIKQLRRSHKERDVITLVTMDGTVDGKTTRFRFKGTQESRIFFDLVGYYLTIDPSTMLQFA